MGKIEKFCWWLVWLVAAALKLAAGAVGFVVNVLLFFFSMRFLWRVTK